MRGALFCVVALFPAVALAQDRMPLSRFERQKAEWLLRERLPCLGCHRLNGRGGVIGPDLTGIADRRTPAFVLGMITSPQGTLNGSGMPRVAMPAEWAQLVAGYLVRGGTATASPANPDPPADATRLSEIRDAGQLYGRLCAACHGGAGAGDGFNAANLPVRPTAHADSAYMSTRPDDTVFDGVFAGGYILDQSHFMPAWGETLSRAQIWELVRYMRQLCRCAGPSWSRP